MTRPRQNPFVRYRLDPTADLASITERLRELAEDASDPEEREAIRAAWEAITKSPMGRFELALDVCPGPPAVPPLASPPGTDEPFEPRLADLLTPGPVLPRLGPTSAEEARTLRVDLAFLLREDEARATGPIGEASQPAESSEVKKR